MNIKYLINVFVGLIYIGVYIFLNEFIPDNIIILKVICYLAVIMYSMFLYFEMKKLCGVQENE